MRKLLILVLVSINTIAAPSFWALFSPHQGKQAFQEIYDAIENSQDTVYLTAYSWSDTKIAKNLEVACLSGVDVKVVLHPPLAKKAKAIKFSDAIEDAGCDVKVAAKQMHEKFVIVDNKWSMNSSANLSSGAKSRYSENFIFNNDQSVEARQVIKTLNKEFAFMWNSAKDFRSNENEESKVMTVSSLTNLPNGEEVPAFYSSSMNFTYKKYSETTKAYKSGKYFRVSPRKNEEGQTWLVKDEIVRNIDAAKENIYMNINHLFVKDVADALVRAFKRGIDIKIVADNQEYKTSYKTKEMVPYFVRKWKEEYGKNSLPPVRVKYYSHAPSPSYWYLNHHKYIIFDYDESDLSKTTLMSGSHNISRTAEHNQYDNMFVYKGDVFAGIQKSFKGEFDRLWFYNRDEADKPVVEIAERLYKPYRGSISLHSTKPISLNWHEIGDIRSKVIKEAPEFFNAIYKNKMVNRDCKYYSIKSKVLKGCPQK